MYVPLYKFFFSVFELNEKLQSKEEKVNDLSSENKVDRYLLAIICIYKHKYKWPGHQSDLIGKYSNENIDNALWFPVVLLHVVETSNVPPHLKVSRPNTTS